MVIYYSILILLIILEFKFALGGVFLKKRRGHISCPHGSMPGNLGILVRSYEGACEGRKEEKKIQSQYFFWFFARRYP
jgi:hypothetical protein